MVFVKLCQPSCAALEALWIIIKIKLHKERGARALLQQYAGNRITLGALLAKPLPFVYY